MSWEEAWGAEPIRWRNEIRAVSPLSQELHEVQLRLHQDLFRLGYEAGQKSRPDPRLWMGSGYSSRFEYQIKCLESEKAELEKELSELKSFDVVDLLLRAKEKLKEELPVVEIPSLAETAMENAPSLFGADRMAIALALKKHSAIKLVLKKD